MGQVQLGHRITWEGHRAHLGDTQGSPGLASLLTALTQGTGGQPGRAGLPTLRAIQHTGETNTRKSLECEPVAHSREGREVS